MGGGGGGDRGGGDHGGCSLPSLDVSIVSYNRKKSKLGSIGLTDKLFENFFEKPIDNRGEWVYNKDIKGSEKPRRKGS